jgi:hypothetical protein
MIVSELNLLHKSTNSGCGPLTWSGSSTNLMAGKATYLLRLSLVVTSKPFQFGQMPFACAQVPPSCVGQILKCYG